MKINKRIYSDAEIKLINEIFDMYIERIYDEDLHELVQQCKEMFLENQTLMQYKKKDLVEIIRMLEHNWAGSIKATELQSRRLENFYNYYKEIGNEELFTKLTSDDVFKNWLG